MALEHGMIEPFSERRDGDGIVSYGLSSYGYDVRVGPEFKIFTNVTLEISNTTPLPARVYAGEGIAQVLFFRAADRCETSYADRAGKYQGQSGITLPRVT